MRKYVLLVIFISISLSGVFWVLFSLEKDDFAQLYRQKASEGTTVVVGNSVVRFASQCDLDKRSIVDMLDSIGGGKGIADLSYGGMTAWEGLDVIRNRLSFGSQVEAAVFLFTPASYAISPQKSRKLIAKSILSGIVSFDMPISRWRKVAESKKSSIDDSSLTYNGVEYGDYKTISRIYASKEVEKTGCPEMAAYDMQFLEFMHWRSLLKMDPEDYADELFVAELLQLKKQKVKPYVVMLPLPTEHYSMISNRSHNTVAMRVEAMKSSLSAAGISFADLTNELPASKFSGEWCACGHLNQDGRMFVSRRVSELINCVK